MRFFVIALLALCFVAQNGMAEMLSSEELSYQRTQDRLERLEKDINIMQQQVFKGDAKFSKKDRAKSPKLEVQISNLEEQIRELNGKLEEAEFNSRSVSDKLDSVVADIEFRLNALEKSVKDEPKKINESKLQDESGLVSKVEKTSEDLTLDLTDSISGYDKAFSYLRKSEYERAEVEFKNFIAHNKGIDLISNAYYWLGETYYVRKNYEQSAVHFLKGYQELPKGNKASDNLMKLAMSLGKLGKKQEACATFAKMLKEFSKVEDSVKKKVGEEKALLKCG